MIAKSMKRWTPLLLLPLLVAGCDDGPASSEVAEVSVLLTDNEGDVAGVWVEIAEVYLQGAGEDGRTVLLGEEDADDLGLIDILSLANTTLDLVSDVEIPAGTYGQLRFVIEGAVLETEGGDVYTFNAEHPDELPATGSLLCPSCSQTGIKVVLPSEAATLPAGATVMVLDFDVSQSFGRQAGMSGMWVMHPVIRGADLGFTGSISGTVDVARDESEDPLVTIPECPAGTARDLTAFVPVATAENLTDDEGAPIVAMTTVQPDGTFSFPFLSTDDYDLGFVAAVAFEDATLEFDADAPGIVSVASGEDTAVDYTITTATCDEA